MKTPDVLHVLNARLRHSDELEAIRSSNAATFERIPSERFGLGINVLPFAVLHEKALGGRDIKGIGGILLKRQRLQHVDNPTVVRNVGLSQHASEMRALLGDIAIGHLIKAIKLPSIRGWYLTETGQVGALKHTGKQPQRFTSALTSIELETLTTAQQVDARLAYPLDVTEGLSVTNHDDLELVAASLSEIMAQCAPIIPKNLPSY